MIPIDDICSLLNVLLNPMGPIWEQIQIHFRMSGNHWSKQICVAWLEPILGAGVNPRRSEEPFPPEWTHPGCRVASKCISEIGKLELLWCFLHAQECKCTSRNLCTKHNFAAIMHTQSHPHCFFPFPFCIVFLYCWTWVHWCLTRERKQWNCSKRNIL